MTGVGTLNRRWCFLNVRFAPKPDLPFDPTQTFPKPSTVPIMDAKMAAPRGADMERRKFIAIAAIGAAWPLMARAQQNVTSAKNSRIGVLWHASNADEEKIYLDVLTKGFSDLGYVEGKNIEFLHRFPADQPERFRTLTRELAEDKVDAIVAGAGLGGKKGKKAPSTAPALFVIVSDPHAEAL